MGGTLTEWDRRHECCLCRRRLPSARQVAPMHKPTTPQQRASHNSRPAEPSQPSGQVRHDDRQPIPKFNTETGSRMVTSSQSEKMM